MTFCSLPLRGTINTVGAGPQGHRGPLWALSLLIFVTGCALTGSPSQKASPSADPDELVGRPSATATSSPPTRSGALWYRIEPAADHLTVHLRLLQPPSRATFFLPGPWAGREDFDTRIALGQATGPDGPLPVAVDRGQGRIDVSASQAPWIELAYRVETTSSRTEATRLDPFATEEQFFAYAPTFLVLPSAGVADQLREIPVEVHLPPDWEVSATWPRSQVQRDPDGQVVGFVADDIGSLRDAFLGAGAHWAAAGMDDPYSPLGLTTAGEFELPLRELHDAALEVVSAYLDTFGTYDRLEAIVLPAAPDAPNHLRGMGRRGGFVLEIRPDQPLDEELLLLLAHEALHCWNGHQLVPEAAAEASTVWFKEGVTHYIALKTLTQQGLISGRFARRELAMAGQFYLANPLVTGETVRPVDRARLPYDRGVLIAMALDAYLAHHSDDTVHIEDWLKRLLHGHAQEGIRTFDPSDLRLALGDITEHLGPGSADEAIEYYDGLIRTASLPVPEIFSSLGLHLLPAADDEPARALPRDSALFHRLFSRASP